MHHLPDDQFSSDPKASTRDVHFAHDLASLKSLTPETDQQSKKKQLPIQLVLLPKIDEVQS